MLSIRHKQITAQPFLGPIDMEKYMDGIEAVVEGGESDKNARVLDYDWVQDIREQCIRQNVSFQFRQCGTFICAALNPWNWNGIDGLLGSFIGTHMLIPFIIGIVVILVGLVICFNGAYRK